MRPLLRFHHGFLSRIDKVVALVLLHLARRVHKPSDLIRYSLRNFPLKAGVASVSRARGRTGCSSYPDRAISLGGEGSICRIRRCRGSFGGAASDERYIRLQAPRETQRPRRSMSSSSLNRRLRTKLENDTIQYTGIAFGQIGPKRGYTPDKNPMLTVTQYNNKPIDDSTFRRSYVMHKRSIDIGLTGKNTESFKYTKLSNRSSQEARRYWDRVSLALRVNDGDRMEGDALIDTSLTGMEIASPQYEGDSGPLPDGTDIAMRFPDENTSLPEFSFRWPGNNESWLPASVNYHKTIYTKAFVNTGQNFYNKFDTLFDAEKFWGVREISPLNGATDRLEMNSQEAQQVLDYWR